MDNNVFDDSIKQSIERLATNTRPAPDSWERMLSHLEQYEKEQHISFDTHIKHQFNNSNTLNKSSKWDLLEQRLHLQDIRIQTLYRQKALEAALLMLLLLTFTNIFFSVSDNSTNNIVAKPTNEIAYPSQSAVANANILSNTTINTAVKHNKIYNTTQKHLISPQNQISNITNQSANTVPILNTLNLAALDSVAKDKHAYTTTVALLENNHETISPILPMALLPFTPLEYAQTTDLAVPRQTPYLIQKESKKHIALGIVGGTNLNIIHTPNELFFNNPIPAYNSLTLGGGGGITLSIETPKRGYETGIFYLSKKYSPKDISIERIGPKGIIYKDALMQIQVNMLEVPLTYRIKKAINTKWGYYYQLGTTVNFITSTYYDTHRSYISGLSSLGSSTTFAVSELNAAKQFNSGLFDGGRWKDNTYATAQIGMGLTYFISPKYSFFTQATFQQHLFNKNIGANDNAYNALSIYWGLKTHF